MEENKWDPESYQNPEEAQGGFLYQNTLATNGLNLQLYTWRNGSREEDLKIAASLVQS